MKYWGRFKTEGSIIAVAMGAIAAGILTDDDLFGPEPERPRVSDPESDALFATPVGIDERASQLPSDEASDRSNETETVATDREPKPEEPFRRKSRARNGASLAENSSVQPDLAVEKTPLLAPPRADAREIALTPIVNDQASLAEPPNPRSPAEIGNSSPSLPAAVAVPAQPQSAVPAIATTGPAFPDQPRVIEQEKGAPAVIAASEPATSFAPAQAQTGTPAAPTPFEAAMAEPDVPTGAPVSPPQVRSEKAAAAPGVNAGSRAAGTGTTAAAIEPKQPEGKAKPSAQIARTAKAATSINPESVRASPVKSQPPRNLASIRARLSPKSGAATKPAAPVPAAAKPSLPLTLADVRARLERTAPKPATIAPDAVLLPAGASALAPGTARIIVPGLTNTAQQDSNPSLAEMLALAPIVNGVPVDTIITVERLGDGSFRLRAGDLRALRVILDPAIGDDDRVALSSLPGVSARYVEATQSLALNIPDLLLTPTYIDARAGFRPIDVSKIVTTSGVLFNYRLFGTAQSGDGRDVRLTGDTEIVGMTPLGLFVTNGTFATSGGRSFVRGDSFFRHEDVARVMTVTVGDFATGALIFSRSVRLGGVQVQSDFQQRPDLFTGPLPQFAGSAALPSAIELYADNLKVFSTNVPPGPFVLRSLPQITGNELRIVTTDASGRQTEITTP